MKNYNDVVEKKRKKNSGYIKKRKAVRLWGCKAVKIKKGAIKREAVKMKKRGYEEKEGLWKKISKVQ